MKIKKLNRLNLKRIVVGIATAMCVAFTSCTQEKIEIEAVTPVGRNVEVHFKALASNNALAEATVNRVRVVIFGSYQSADRGKLIYNKVATAKADGSIDRILISAGLRDIYLIVNEPVSEANLYNAISTPEELLNMQVLYKGVTAEAALKDGLPMFASYLNQMVTGESNVFGAGVEYLLAKVSLNILFTDGGIEEIPNVGDVEVTSMKVLNIPEYGTLTPLVYSGNDYNPAVVVHTTNTINQTTTYSTEFYLPEHIVKSAESKTFVEVKGINKTTNKVLTWIVKLGDATVTNPQAPANTPYNITRNKHYTVTGTIKSYGVINDWDIKVTVLPWNTVNINEELGRFVAFEKVADAANNVIADGANLSAEGTTLNVTCSTNIGGWYTVTSDAKGGVVHTSSPTTSVSGVTAQTVSIPILKLPELTYAQSYTVRIYHPTIAMEAIGYVKLLKFTQLSDGIIPTAVLAAAGWPIDRLPSSGLQLAKRGDKVLPNGVAQNDDPSRGWKTSKTSTPGTATGLGRGLSNTAAMKGAEHPAAQYCRDMGPEWYLPSKDEMLLIDANASFYGPSYVLNHNYYWSSSESNVDNSWFLLSYFAKIFDNGGKTLNAMVRCVREI